MSTKIIGVASWQPASSEERTWCWIPGVLPLYEHRSRSEWPDTRCGKSSNRMYIAYCTPEKLSCPECMVLYAANTLAEEGE